MENDFNISIEYGKKSLSDIYTEIISDFYSVSINTNHKFQS